MAQQGNPAERQDSNAPADAAGTAYAARQRERFDGHFFETFRTPFRFTCAASFTSRGVMPPAKYHAFVL
jgi:hypothetical protein